MTNPVFRGNRDRGGADGAARVLSLLAEELTESMHLAGCSVVPAACRLRVT